MGVSAFYEKPSRALNVAFQGPKNVNGLDEMVQNAFKIIRRQCMNVFFHFDILTQQVYIM